MRVIQCQMPLIHIWFLSEQCGGNFFKRVRAHLFAHKWFQVSLFDIANSIYQVFLSDTNNLFTALWFQINIQIIIIIIIILRKGLNSSIWPADETLTCTTNPSQSLPRCNVNKGVLQIPRSSTTGVLLSDAVYCHTRTLAEGSYPAAEAQLAYSIAPANESNFGNK